jgi:hypothetical protein
MFERALWNMDTWIELRVSHYTDLWSQSEADSSDWNVANKK